MERLKEGGRREGKEVESSPPHPLLPIFALAPFFARAKRWKPRSSLFAPRKRLLRRLSFGFVFLLSCSFLWVQFLKLFESIYTQDKLNFLLSYFIAQLHFVYFSGNFETSNVSRRLIFAIYDRNLLDYEYSLFRLVRRARTKSYSRFGLSVSSPGVPRGHFFFALFLSSYPRRANWKREYMYS